MPHPEDKSEDWPLCSVWAVNIAMLEEFLYAHYRNQPSFDPTAYLEKLFHRRINVPPLFQSKQDNECIKLWVASLDPLAKHLAGGEPDLEKLKQRTAEALAAGLNYAVLGNLRLYQSVRERCCEYWRFRIRIAQREHGSESEVSPRISSSLVNLSIAPGGIERSLPPAVEIRMRRSPLS